MSPVPSNLLYSVLKQISNIFQNIEWPGRDSYRKGSDLSTSYTFGLFTDKISTRDLSGGL